MLIETVVYKESVLKQLRVYIKVYFM